MQLKKWIPDFLRPTDDPAPPVRIYDVPLRRELFHKARPGNEQMLTASRNNSVAASDGRRRSSVVVSWHPGMAFGR